MQCEWIVSSKFVDSRILLEFVNSDQLRFQYEFSISSVFDKCSMLQQTQSRPNHTSYRNFHFNEFVANALRDNIGSKQISL